MSETVEIEIKPWSKLTVHEVIKTTVENLVKEQAIGIQSGQLTLLQWAAGILFRAAPFPITDEVAKEMLQGHLHWASVEFAALKKFTPVLKDPTSNVDVPVVDVSTNKVFLKLAQQLL
ncbi:MAG: hypothetical protein ACE5PO_02625 [Candidatus Bathyarchaeia archaeon]